MFEPYLYQLSIVVVWLIIASLKALPIIVLVIVLRKILVNKLPAIARYYLWMSVLLCLTVPVGWQVNFDFNQSIQSAISNSKEATISTNQSYESTNKIIPTSVNHSTPVNNSKASTTNMFIFEQKSMLFNTRLLYGFSLLWLFGVVFLSILTCVNLTKFNRIKRNATKPCTVTLSVFEACKQTINPGRKVTLLQSKRIHSPIVMGWLSPTLLIPLGLEKKLTKDELSYVFIHEFAHVKRQDILFNWIVSIVQIMHWFNPLLWLSCKLIRTDMEASCDAFVLNRLPHSDRHPYGNTLIQLAGLLPPSPHSISTVGILENHVELTERLTMISKSKPTTVKMLSLIALLLTASAALALTQPSNTENKTLPVKNTNLSNTNSMSLGQIANILGSTFGKKILVGRADADAMLPIDVDLKKITYADFLSILKVNKFTANEIGNNIQVFPLKSLRFTALPIIKEGEDYPEDQFITGFITLDKGCAASLIPMFRPMAPKYAHMAADRYSNTIILTDTYSNYKRIKESIEKFDVRYDKKMDCKPRNKSNK